MARIELEGARPMEELRGFCRFERSENSPYTADKLTDDEFNFISGINYAITKMAKSAKNCLDCCEIFTDYFEPLQNYKRFIAANAIAYFTEVSQDEINHMMTAFIERHEDE